MISADVVSHYLPQAEGVLMGAFDDQSRVSSDYRCVGVWRELVSR